MSEIQIREGNLIYEKGTPLTMLSIIIEGNVTVHLQTESITLSGGDVIGLIDLYSGMHSCTYVADTDVVVDSYPYKSISLLPEIYLQDSSYAKLFATSALYQLFAIVDMCHISAYNCDSLYTAIMEYHRDYSKLCKLYQLTPKNLPALESIHPLVLDNKSEGFITAYYKDLHSYFKSRDNTSLFTKHDFISGFLYRVSQDIYQFLNMCDEMEEYLSNLSCIIINSEKLDFLDLFTTLLVHASHKKEDTAPLIGAISKMFIRSKNVKSISSDLYQSRLAEYRKLSNQLEEASAKAEEYENPFSAVAEKLKNSLSTILDFADVSEDYRQIVIHDVNSYKEISDKTALSSELSELRKRLTEHFFTLYKETFFASLLTSTLPEPVRMFLLFGYMDEDLCGLENTADLFYLLTTTRSDDSNHIYLFYDWLLLIYKGKKEPRRDEFDQDYPAYLQSLVNDGKLTSQEADTLLHHPKQKVIFELENMFASAVKMTYGRLQTYCPVLSEHDFLKMPEETLLSSKVLREQFNYITNIDFSAFYREVLFTDSSLPNGREYVQREILPDIILLPNIGTRAVLWQEIEGRNRSTPSCMLFPVFCMADVNQLVLRLTGEFRWEMCKRIQGNRWNDVSNLSLTSEYFDYLQFYKKNKELSSQAKEKCRQQLARSKNRFRESFILDYISWITYESKGSPHMNKITRKIFMTYCPFRAEYREELQKNPIYSVMIEKYENKKNKELTRINSIIYRLKRNGRKEIPAELEHQVEFIKM